MIFRFFISGIYSSILCMKNSNTWIGLLSILSKISDMKTVIILNNYNGFYN